MALSQKLEELRVQSRSTAREGLMLRHQVSENTGWGGAGWVDFDMDVPLSCPADFAKFPSAQADMGRLWNDSNKVDPTQVLDHQPHPVGTSRQR